MSRSRVIAAFGLGAAFASAAFGFVAVNAQGKPTSDPWEGLGVASFQTSSNSGRAVIFLRSPTTGKIKVCGTINNLSVSCGASVDPGS